MCSAKRYFLKFRKTHRKIPVSEPLFNKAAGLRRRCFPANFAKFLRTPVLQNTSGDCFLRMLLVVILKSHYKTKYIMEMLFDKSRKNLILTWWYCCWKLNLSTWTKYNLLKLKKQSCFLTSGSKSESSN